LATISQYPPSESSKIRQHAFEGTLYKHLRYTLQRSRVRAVAFYETVGSYKLAVIQVEQGEPAEVWDILNAAANRLPFVKIMVAVDSDVSMKHIDSILLAILTRTQPHRDYRIETLAAPQLNDFSLEHIDALQNRSPEPGAPRPRASRLLIDATMKWPYPPVSLPAKEFMDQALRLWEREGLPPLKLQEPWWGIDLGFWSDENERHARAAVEGDYYRAGNEYLNRRRKL